MLGPDGVTGRSTAKLRGVSTDGYSLHVEIAADEERFHRRFLTVTADRRVGRGEWRVTIRGGNTNDGDVARYRAAVAAYEDAIKVAETLWRVVQREDTWYEGFEQDGTLVPVIHGEPDYVLAMYLLLQGEDFGYIRGQEPTEDSDPSFYGLARLRERVVEHVREAVT